MRRTATMFLLAVVTFIALGVTLFAFCASAQAPTPADDLATIQHLDVNERASFEGWLVHEPMLLRLRSEIETLQHRLEVDIQLQVDRGTALVSAEQARTHAAEESATLHDSLWHARETQLLADLDQARRATVREWWEAPSLWLAIGVALCAVVGGLVLGLLH